MNEGLLSLFYSRQFYFNFIKQIFLSLPLDVSALFGKFEVHVSCSKQEEDMNNSKHTVIEVDTNLVEIEKGFNPREAVIGDLCYEQEPVKSMIVSIKQAFKEGRQVDMIKVVKEKVNI